MSEDTGYFNLSMAELKQREAKGEPLNRICLNPLLKQKGT